MNNGGDGASPAAPQAETADGNNSPAGIRVVDPSWRARSSCKDGAWPYIDQRCLAKGHTEDANKIGPGVSEALVQSSPPLQNAPVGSTTAIAPARPKMPVAADGLEERKSSSESADPAAAPAESADNTPPSTTEAETVSQSAASSDEIADAEPSPRIEEATKRRSERVEAVRRARRAARAERAKRYEMARVRRRAHVRAARAPEPPPPNFFFPFGWFGQAQAPSPNGARQYQRPSVFFR